MHAKLIVTGVSVIALLGACTTTDPYSSTPRRNNTGTGAIAGAIGGAVLGYLTNTSNSEEGRKNALIGAGIGALGGAAVGAYMDRQQRELEAELSGTGVGVARQGDNLVLRMPADVTFATAQASIDNRFYPTAPRTSLSTCRAAGPRRSPSIWSAATSCRTGSTSTAAARPSRSPPTPPPRARPRTVGSRS